MRGSIDTAEGARSIHARDTRFQSVIACCGRAPGRHARFLQYPCGKVAISTNWLNRPQGARLT